MGCGGSKAQKGVVNSQVPPADFVPKVLELLFSFNVPISLYSEYVIYPYSHFCVKEIKDVRPDKLRKDITELFAEYVSIREHIRPLLAEKYGVSLHRLKLVK